MRTKGIRENVHENRLAFGKRYIILEKSPGTFPSEKTVSRNVTSELTSFWLKVYWNLQLGSNNLS